MKLSDFVESTAQQAQIAKQGYCEIKIANISRDENQPRKIFDEEALNELADDIEKHGLIQPIIVRKAPDSDNKFIIIAGERRYRAFQMLSKESIPCIIKDDAAQDNGYIQISENLKRDDLKFYEIAEFICERVKQGEKQLNISKQLGVNKNRISEYASWAKAPDWLKSYKDKFSSMIIFHAYLKESEKHPDELKEFLENSEEDTYSIVLLNNFQSSLESAGNEYDGSDAQSLVESSEISDQDDSDDNEDFSDNTSISSDTIDDADDVSTTCSVAEDDTDITESLEEEIESEFLKNPKIYGLYNGERVEILYKKRATSTESVFIKHENTEEPEEVLCEEILLSSITE